LRTLLGYPLPPRRRPLGELSASAKRALAAVAVTIYGALGSLSRQRISSRQVNNWRTAVIARENPRLSQV
jgi:hypothetical protein